MGCWCKSQAQGQGLVGRCTKGQRLVAVGVLVLERVVG